MTIVRLSALTYRLLTASGLAAGVLFSQAVAAACNCGSKSAASPCTGTSIKVVVTGDKEEDHRQVTFNWAFTSDGKPAACGQFANGDYWIAPAQGETSVTVTSAGGSGSGPLYVDENPALEKMGFLSNDYGNLDKNENLVNKFPLTFAKDTSLVGVIQRDESRHGNCGTKAIYGSCVDAYNVVTVLQEVPPSAGANIIRPNISRAEKELLSWDDFELARLPGKSYFDGTDDSGLEAIRTTWSHHSEVMSMRDNSGGKFSEGGRAFRADLVAGNYAASVASEWHTNVTIMMSQDLSLAEKKPALAAMLAYGKDIYYSVFDKAGKRTRYFGTGAGQWTGRFSAAAFFAAMVRDSHYGDVFKTISQTQVDTNTGVHELDQLNIGPNGPVWGDGNDIYNPQDLGRYWGEMFSARQYTGAPNPEDGNFRGKKTSRDPYGYIDGPGAFPGAQYAGVNAGVTKALAAEMLLIPEMCEVVNYDAVVEYAIRIVDVGVQTANDPCAPPDPRESRSCSPYYVKDCKYYGLSNTGTATWGPDPKDLTKCIKNGTDPLTGKPQNGRFGHIKPGSPEAEFPIGYRVRPVEHNWNAIRDGRNSCRRLNRLEKPGNFRQVNAL